MGTTMNHPACEWVRGRLPLLRGPLDTADDPTGDGGDLAAADRRAIERHLAACPSCRTHRSGLVRAFEALGAAAAAVPAGPDAASLWPILERRIAAQQAPGFSSPPSSRPREDNAADRFATCAALDGERPLQSAWLQDTLMEGLAASGLAGRRGRSSWWIIGASLAASILVLVVGLPGAWRRQADAEARIRSTACRWRA